MSISEWGYKEAERSYNLNLTSKDLKSIKKEFDRVYKLFYKNNIYLDNINLNLDIRYHDIDIDEVD